MLFHHYWTSFKGKRCFYCVHSLEHIVILQRSLGLLAVVSNMDVKFHKDKRASFCRRCGDFVELNSETSRHKPKLAADFSNELQLVDGLDISSDTEANDPIFLCQYFVAKLERLKKSKNRNDHPLKFPGDKGKFSVFSTHESYIKEGECPICSRNVRKSPRKKRAHDSDMDSQYASEIASEHPAGA